MDVIIPYMHGNYPDLKFALRSLEKFGPEVRDLIIVGEVLPTYINPDKVVFIRHADCYDDKFKEKNQYEKVLSALNYAVNCDIFLYMHDDHFLLSKFRDIAWYDKTLFNKFISLNPEGIYRKTIGNTIKITGNLMFNFDVHAPMVMDRASFFNLQQADWNKNYGYCLKSLYCWYIKDRLESKDISDLKIRYPSNQTDYMNQVNGREWFSNDDLAWDDMGEMKHFLTDLYPDHSRWEK
jgi:hypothetical protein